MTRVIYDPLTGQPFPNNVVPLGRFDPAALKIIQLYPLPNVPGQRGANGQPIAVRESLLFGSPMRQVQLAMKLRW